MLHTGDIDNDGNLDIFVAGVFTQEVIVLFGDGAGNFQKSIVKSGISTHEGRLGDIDSDGDLDIICKTLSNTKSNPGNSSVSVDVYLNNGSGSVDISHRRNYLGSFSSRSNAIGQCRIFGINGRFISRNSAIASADNHPAKGIYLINSGRAFIWPAAAQSGLAVE